MLRLVNSKDMVSGTSVLNRIGICRHFLIWLSDSRVRFDSVVFDFVQPYAQQFDGYHDKSLHLA